MGEGRGEEMGSVGICRYPGRRRRCGLSARLLARNLVAKYLFLRGLLRRVVPSQLRPSSSRPLLLLSHLSRLQSRPSLSAARCPLGDPLLAAPPVTADSASRGCS